VVQHEVFAPLHRYENPVKGALAQEFDKGFQEGVKRQASLVEAWLEDLDGLRKAKAEENEENWPAV
jgi:hypothetical protein